MVNLPVDKDEKQSSDIELINSIFAPIIKDEDESLSVEIKSGILGVAIFLLLSTNKGNDLLRGYSKNTQTTKLVLSIVSAAAFYMYLTN